MTDVSTEPVPARRTGRTLDGAADGARGVEPTFRRSLRRAMILPLVVLTAGSIFLVVLVLYLGALHRRVAHSDGVIARATLLQRLAAERESALRGYLLSRDPALLRPYNEVDLRLSPAFDDLQDRITDEAQLERVRAARVEVIRFRHYAAQQVDRVFVGAAAAEIGSHVTEGAAIEAGIRTALQQFIDEEQGVRSARAVRADLLTWYLLVVGVTLGLLLGGAVALATAGQMRLVRGRYVEVVEEQHRTQEALARANDRLRDADRHKDEFLGVLSHELRNPLAPIRNCVHILRAAAPSSEQAKRAHAILERQVSHLARLVDDLLDVKRLSAGKMRVSLQRIDLVAPIRETVEDLRPLFAQRTIRLDLDVRQAPLWVNGDLTRLAQVVANLLQNSAKFTDAGGHVSVVVEERGGRAVIQVRDDGVGIPRDVLPRLFRPFEQGEQSADRSRGGLGLGLALVHGIAAMHGGEVAARSEGPGTGTEIEVSLPLAAAPAQDAPATEPPVARDGKRCVLVIEDSEDAAASLRDVVELAGGHEVHVVHDGAEGVATARRLRPDVILCDLGLPVLDGYEVARQLRASGDADEATLVALSGYAGPDVLDRVFEAGFHHHVAKPADVDAVLKIIADATPRERACA